MSVDELIRERLETLVEPVDDPGTVVASIEARRQELRRRRPRPMLAAAAVIVVVAAVGGALWLGGEPQREVVAGPDATEPTESSPAGASAQAEVSVRGEGLGPLEVTTSPLSPWATGFTRHELTFTNTGDTPVYVQDVRTGALVTATGGDTPGLLVATDGCGYGGNGTEPVIPGCRHDYRPLGEIAPGASVLLPLMLYADLPGLAPLTDGTYTFELGVEYRADPFTHPAETGTVGTVEVTYRNLTSLLPDATALPETTAPPETTTTPPADATEPLTARLELSSTTVQAGATLDGEVVVQNDTGEPVSVGGCGPYSVTLQGDGFEQVDPSAMCLRASTLPVGESRWPITVWASHLICGAGEVPPCDPDGFAPGLPPGDYTVTVTASPGAPTPHPGSIMVTPAP